MDRFHFIDFGYREALRSAIRIDIEEAPKVELCLKRAAAEVQRNPLVVLILSPAASVTVTRFRCHVALRNWNKLH